KRKNEKQILNNHDPIKHEVAIAISVSQFDSDAPPLQPYSR
ncbi:unnamed protein product, partial [Rotaria sp. Silwood2]